MESNREKVSYCIGYETGKNLKAQFKEIEADLLKKGFADSLGEKTPALEMKEINEILTALNEQLQKQQRQMIDQISERNKKEGEEFLEENKSNEGVVVLPSGLQYKVLKEGNGASPTMYDTVSVHYRGTLTNGTVFDSSYERNQPQEFPVNRVIPGWSEALKLMKVGSKWEIFIPSYLAYGENGYGPQIEPNKVLVFEMELLKIN